MCCNHVLISPGVVTSSRLTYDAALEARLLRTANSVHPAMTTVISFRITWTPVRAPVTTEEPVAQPLFV